MGDIVDSATRSKMMAAVRSENTKPELKLRRAIHALGLRYRLHCKSLPGRPDIVFPRFRAVIFVHGCFWHRHTSCKYTTTPSTRVEFWTEKFEANLERDRRNVRALVEAGWRVAVVWECELKPGTIAAVADRIRSWVLGNNPSLNPERTVYVSPRDLAFDPAL